MTTKLLLSTLATAAMFFGAPAYSAEEKHAGDKGQVHCDPAKDKNCRDEHPAKGDDHKAGDKHDEKEGKAHSEKDHGKDEMKK